jgi:hypothetical protein
MDASTAQDGKRALVGPTESKGRKGPMEQVISVLVDGIIVPVTSVIPFLLTSGILFAVFALLWAGFGIGLVWNQGGLDAAWEWVRSLPLLLQGVAWLLFLPVVGALWVWETGWPLVVRLVLVVGLAGWSLAMFMPRSTQG